MKLQVLKKELQPIDRAKKYYGILSVLNNLELTNKELELLAFTAVNGSITNPAAKAEFCKMFKSTDHTIKNILSSLKKKGLLYKYNNTTRIRQEILHNFSEYLNLGIKLW